ncbi:MAG: hypothetical protein IKV61_02245 [Clostridia bacterium]|nr:hypothetical protein [Clostridia bacterium]
MMQKIVFDTTKNMQFLSADGFFGQGIEICASSAYDAVYSIAIKYGKNKTAQVVCRENDFQVVGATVTKALKDAKANFTTLLVGDVDLDSEKANSSFNFDGGYVLAVGDAKTLKLAQYYASKIGIDCHALLTEPCCEEVFLKRVRIPTKSISVSKNVKPFKTVIYDFDIIKKASNSAFATAYISIMGNLISLIDYKMRVMLTGEEFDEINYNALKKVVYMASNLANYKNAKDVLIYSCALISLIKAKNEQFTCFPIELFADALNLSSNAKGYGDRLMTAFLKLVPLYKMFFTNDFSGLLSVPNYLADAYELENLTKQFGGNFVSNVKVPSPKRLDLILEMLRKTQGAFNSEICSVFSIANSIKKVYLNILKQTTPFEFLPYGELKQALKLCTYLTDKQSVLTVFRDLGVLNCVNL